MILRRLLRNTVTASLLFGFCVVSPINAQVLTSKKMPNGKYGIYDKDGMCVIPAVYDFAESFAEKDAAALIKIGDKYNYVDRKNHILFKESFDNAESFKNGMALVCKDNLYYYVDYDGKRISPMFASIVERKRGDFTYIEARKADTKKYVMLDYKFNEILPGEYNNIIVYKLRDFYVVGIWDEKGSTLVNLDGKEALPRIYEIGGIGNYSSEISYEIGYKKYDKYNVDDKDMDFFCVKSGGLYGLIDALGTVVVPFKAKSTYKLKYKTAPKAFKKTIVPYIKSMKAVDFEPLRKFYASDKPEKAKNTYNELIESLPKQTKEFEEITVRKTRRGSYYFYYPKSKKRVDNIYYQKITPMGNLFLVKRNKMFGVVDLNAKEILPCKYNSLKAWVAKEGKVPLLLAKIGNKLGIVDCNGTELLECKYDDLSVWSDEDDKPTLLLATIGDKKGIVSVNGSVRTPIKYNEIYYPISGFSEAITKDGARLINAEGKIVGKRTYEYIDIYTNPGKPVGHLIGYSTVLDSSGNEEQNIPSQIFKRAYNLDNSEIQMKYDLYCLAIKMDDGSDGVAGASLCNIGCIYENGGDEDTALAYYDKAAAKGNAQGEKNAKIIRRQRRSRKLQAIGNALGQIGQALAQGANTMNLQQNVDMSNNNVYGGANMYGGSNGDGDYSSSSGSSRESAMYNDIYRRWERNAESCYNSLTTTGYRTKDKDNNHKGSAGGSWSSANYTGMKANLRKAQAEMRKTRQEARRKGITIQQSKWETATVSY